MLKFNQAFKQYVSEGDFSYDPMENLGPKALKIRELLKSIGDDEMTEEHSYEAAEMIAGSPNEWAREDYQELIESLAHVIRAFGFQSMN